MRDPGRGPASPSPVPAFRQHPRERLAQRQRDPRRPAVADTGDGDTGADEQLTRTHHRLVHRQRRPARLDDARLDIEHVIHQRGTPEIDFHAPHREGEPALLAMQARLVDADQAQAIAAPALAIAQIIGMVDDPGEIRVLVIDPQPQPVDAVRDHAGERVALLLTSVCGWRSVRRLMH